MSSCINPRLPAAGGEVASEWEAAVSIVQSDHGATWRRAVFSSCNGFEAFWLRGLCLQGRQQAGGSNVLCQTEGADVTVRGGGIQQQQLFWDSSKEDWFYYCFDKAWTLAQHVSTCPDSSLPQKRLLPCNFKENGMFCGLLPRKGEYGLDTHSHSPCFTGHQLLALDCFSLNVWSACSATNSQGFVVLKEGGEVRIVHMTGSPESCTFCTF